MRAAWVEDRRLQSRTTSSRFGGPEWGDAVWCGEGRRALQLRCRCWEEGGREAAGIARRISDVQMRRHLCS